MRIKSIEDGWYQYITNYAVGGILVKDNIIIKTAPIYKCFVGNHIAGIFLKEPLEPIKTKIEHPITKTIRQVCSDLNIKKPE